MTVLAVLRKGVREQRRDLWVLLLSIATSPLFVFIYWMFYGVDDTAYRLCVVVSDSPGHQVHDAVEALRETSTLRISMVDDMESAKRTVMDGNADAAIELPHEFNAAVSTRSNKTQNTSREPISVRLVGDLTNPRYMVAAIMSFSAIEDYVADATGEMRLLELDEEALGSSASKTSLDAYVPGLLILAIVMLIFQASMSVAREMESGTLIRLKMAAMKPADFLAGISIVHIAIGMLSIALTLLVAQALGFHSQGPIWVAFVVGAITILPIIGVGLIIASLSRGVSQAFIIANFPMMLFMFFSGSLFPVSKILTFQLGGHTIGLFDILPPTHAVAALNKVLTMGADLKAIAYELSILIVLSALYFIVGVHLFSKRLAEV